MALTNEQVVEQWRRFCLSDRSSEEGRHNGKFTLYYEGSVIYSYGPHYPIADWRPHIALVNSNSSTATTNKHMRLVMDVLNMYQVPVLFVGNPLAQTTHEHEANMEAMVQDACDIGLKYQRARLPRTKAVYKKHVLRLCENLAAYAKEVNSEDERASDALALVRAYNLLTHPKEQHHVR